MTAASYFMLHNWPPSRVLTGLVLAIATLLLAFWTIISSKVIRLQLTESRYCNWKLNQWYSGRCELSYYEDRVCKGRLRVHKGLLEWPTAVFPGPDDQRLICIYEMDTTVAVFTIELNQRSEQGAVPPSRLRSIVLFSNFTVRACTHDEVVYLRDYLRSESGPLWRNSFALFGSAASPVKFRNSLVNALALGTIPQSERTGDWLHYAHPQIPPEG